MTRSSDVFLICTWTNGWANNRNAVDFGRHCAHYDVTVMRVPCVYIRVNNLEYTRIYHLFIFGVTIYCIEVVISNKFSLSNKAGFILHARIYTRIRRLSTQLFILLLLFAPSAYADCRCQSSNTLNFQCQRRHSSLSRKPSKVTEGDALLCIGTYADVYRRIRSPVYTFIQGATRYAVATHRQPQAWTSEPAAGAWSINLN